MNDIEVLNGDVDSTLLRNRVTVVEQPTEVITNLEQPTHVTVVEEATNVYVSLIGAQGAPGSTFISGTGSPSPELGAVGDIYIDTSANAYWGPKTESGWGSEPFYTVGLTNRYVYTQEAASSEWVIDHNLGGRPSITVVDSAATTVIGEVSYVSNSRVIVRFTSPFSGFAYLT